MLFALLMNFSFAGEDSTSIKNKNNRIDEWFAIDKVQHFMYSAFVSFGTQYVLVNKIQIIIRSRIYYMAVISEVEVL